VRPVEPTAPDLHGNAATAFFFFVFFFMAMIVILCVSVVCRQVILFERRGFGPWARAHTLLKS
jgi:hypothetical protein